MSRKCRASSMKRSFRDSTLGSSVVTHVPRRRRPHPQLTGHEVPGDRPFCAGDLDVMCLRSAPVVEPNMGGDVGANRSKTSAASATSSPSGPLVVNAARTRPSVAEQPSQIVEGMADRVVDSATELANGRIARSPVLPRMPRRADTRPRRPRRGAAGQWPFRSKSSAHPLQSRVEAELEADEHLAATRRSASASRSRPFREWETGFSRRTWQPASRHACAVGTCTLVGFATIANVGASSSQRFVEIRRRSWLALGFDRQRSLDRCGRVPNRPRRDHGGSSGAVARSSRTRRVDPSTVRPAGTRLERLRHDVTELCASRPRRSQSSCSSSRSAGPLLEVVHARSPRWRRSTIGGPCRRRACRSALRASRRCHAPCGSSRRA